MALEAVRDRVAYHRARLHPELEQRDLCSTDIYLDTEALTEHPEFNQARSAPDGAGIIGNGKILKRIPGMGTVYDWRASPWTPANGGRITPVVFVQHIPVVPNMSGIADFVRL